MALQKIEVSSEELVEHIGLLSQQELDELPFGVIELDDTGAVLRYNRYEERFANRKREDVVGKNFFTEIAPCTRVQKFYGAFQQGIDQRRLSEVFDFDFHFPAGTRGVRIRMIYSESPRTGIWIFVTPSDI